MVNYHAGSPGALLTLRIQISGYPPASSFRTALIQIPLYYLFLIALFGALLGAAYRSSLFSFGRELDCWSSHRWYDVNGRRSRYWLIKMVLVKRADELSKVLDR